MGSEAPRLPQGPPMVASGSSASFIFGGFAAAVFCGVARRRALVDKLGQLERRFVKERWGLREQLAIKGRRRDVHEVPLAAVSSPQSNSTKSSADPASLDPPSSAHNPTTPDDAKPHIISEAEQLLITDFRGAYVRIVLSFALKTLTFGAAAGWLHFFIGRSQEQFRVDALERLEEQRETLKLMDFDSLNSVKPIPLEEMGDSEDNIQRVNEDLMRRLEARDLERSKPLSRLKAFVGLGE